MVRHDIDSKDRGSDQQEPSQNAGRAGADVGHETEDAGPGATTVTTSGMNPRRESQPEARPEQATTLQTSEVSGSIFSEPFGNVGGIVEERRNDAKKEQGDARGKSRGHAEDKEKLESKKEGYRDDAKKQQRDPRHDSRRHAEGKDKQGSKKEESGQVCISKEWIPGKGNWKQLLITCVVALVCGVVGAWAFTGLSGSSSDKESKGSNKAEQSGQSGGGQKKSDEQSGGESSARQDDTKQAGASASKVAGLHATEGTEAVTKDAWLDANFEHLSHRVDLLAKRLSKMTLPEQESPAALHALQMQVADVENDFEQVAALPAKMRQLERDMSSLKEELTILKLRLPREDVPNGSNQQPADAGLSLPTSDANDELAKPRLP